MRTYTYLSSEVILATGKKNLKRMKKSVTKTAISKTKPANTDVAILVEAGFTVIKGGKRYTLKTAVQQRLKSALLYIQRKKKAKLAFFRALKVSRAAKAAYKKGTSMLNAGRISYQRFLDFVDDWRRASAVTSAAWLKAFNN